MKVYSLTDREFKLTPPDNKHDIEISHGEVFAMYINMYDLKEWVDSAIKERELKDGEKKEKP